MGAGLLAVVLAAAWGWLPLGVLGVGAIGVVLMALGYLFRPVTLQVDREIQPRRVPRSAEALAYFDIVNKGLLPVPSISALQRFGNFDVRVVLPRIGRSEQVLRTFPLPTGRRGVFNVGPLEAIRSDPFRVVRRTWRYCGDDELWVYPRVLPFKPLPTGLSRPLEGPTSDTAPQGSITFHRLREYVVGDDLRMVHWKSTARTGTLMVRHNIDTSQPYSVIVVDLRPGLYSTEGFELALDAAASAVMASAAGGAPLQLRTTGGERIGGPGNYEPQPLMDALTLVEATGKGSLSNELVALRHERGGTSLTIVTGDVETAELAGLSVLRRRFQRVVALCIDEEVQTPEVSGGTGPGVLVVKVGSTDHVVGAWNRAVGS